MTQKIPGIFYPLKHQEWVKACKELTLAEKDTLYYIRTLDPLNKGIDVSAAAFLNWASSVTNVRDIYKALEVAIIRGWEQ